MKSPFKNLNIGDYIRAEICYQDSTFQTSYGIKGIVTEFINTPVKFNNRTRSKNIIQFQNFSGDIGYPQLTFKSDIKILKQNKYADFIPTINNIEDNHMYLYNGKPIKILSIDKESKCLNVVDLLEVFDIPKFKYKNKSYIIMESQFNLLTRVEKFEYE
ncbi:hypothetical protein [Clostridium sp.]|uniref:hypothetical protein n=1 Tax=Clostridium sp. TaxID=1506 RepID=UPI002602EC3A|nr:hypothetical protein [Clostridium sp.]